MAKRAKKPRPSKPMRKPKVPQEPLENLFLWKNEVRLISNEELYRQLVRDGALLRPATTGGDKEWMHEDSHGDETYHQDGLEHDDFSYHLDYPPKHLDDHGDRPGTHDDSGLLPPGGHGDKSGDHLDRWLSHGDESGHYDGTHHADRPPTHWDKHYDTFEGHWDETRRRTPKPPPGHLDVEA